MFRHAFSLLATSALLVASSLLCKAQVNPDISVDCHFTSGSPATYYQITPGTSASITALLTTDAILTNVSLIDRFYGLTCSAGIDAKDTPLGTTLYMRVVSAQSKQSRIVHPNMTIEIHLTTTGTDAFPIGTFEFSGNATATEPKTGFESFSIRQTVDVQVAPYA